MIFFAFAAAFLAAIETAPMPRIVVPPAIGVLPGETPREISPSPTVPVVPVD